MTKPDTRRVAVLGAGPIGLEAALYARSLGFAVTVYERGQAGEHVRRWGHVRLFSPFGMNSTPLGRATLRNATLPGEHDCVTGAEHLAVYLAPLAASDLLKESIQTESLVIRIGRSGYLKSEAPGDAKRGQTPFRLLVRKANGERVDEADIVIDCTGTYATHRWMGDGGIPSVGELGAEQQICWGLDDVLGGRKAHYAGKSILLVGSGYSAATSACLTCGWCGWHAARAASRCRASPMTRSRSATDSPPGPITWPHAATATSNSTRSASCRAPSGTTTPSA
jgi:hypothetical protein